MLIIINWSFGMRFAVLSNLGRLAFSKYGVGLYYNKDSCAPRFHSRSQLMIILKPILRFASKISFTIKWLVVIILSCNA